ncbi:MAG TPA: hypothetical protein VJ735_05610, partial [Actinomycetes bacterium]|nr:hypothetical protein [Actinomycetes bacterium]
LIGQDTNGRDGWSLAWRYHDQPLLAHLTVNAIGLSGTSTGAMLGLYHPDPASAPRILSVTTTPTLPREGGFLRLPAGAGKLLFRVQTVNNTQRMRFLLSPTGTDTLARLLGEDINGRDGWTLAWRYPDEPLLAHLTVRAIGSGGTSLDTVRASTTPTPPADATNRMRTLRPWPDRWLALHRPRHPTGAGSQLTTARTRPRANEPTLSGWQTRR